LASTGAIRQFLAKNKSEFDPRKYLQQTINEMKAICVARYEAFGTAGNASKIKAVSLEAMFQSYEAGELDPKVN
jgi:fructose-bisphosphate aldolase class II